MQRKKISGHFLAEDEADLRAKLSLQNLFLVSCKVESDKGPNAFFTVSGKVTIVELTNFCHQFAIMVSAGIPIIDSLDALSKQKFSGYFVQILLTVYEDVKSGMLLSDAMKKFPKVFPDFFVNMVYVGEVSGSLDIVLNNLADYYEKDSAQKRKIKSALSYPIMLLVLTIGVIALMMFYVMPMFNNALSSMDVEMPGISKALFSASTWLTANWRVILLVLLAVALILFLLFRLKQVKYGMDWLKMHVPGFRKMNVCVLSARFSRSMGLLLGRGMDIVDALRVMQKLVGNRYTFKIFEGAIEEVNNGATISQAFGPKKIFHPVLLQMIETGEKSGTLDEVLSSTCNFFDSEVDYSIQRLTGMLQPILMLFMGVSIGLMFFAMYAPMISIMEQAL